MFDIDLVKTYDKDIHPFHGDANQIVCIKTDSYNRYSELEFLVCRELITDKISDYFGPRIRPVKKTDLHQLFDEIGYELDRVETFRRFYEFVDAYDSTDKLFVILDFSIVDSSYTDKEFADKLREVISYIYGHKRCIKLLIITGIHAYTDIVFEKSFTQHVTGLFDSTDDGRSMSIPASTVEFYTRATITYKSLGVINNVDMKDMFAPWAQSPEWIMRLYNDFTEQLRRR